MMRLAILWAERITPPAPLAMAWYMPGPRRIVGEVSEDGHAVGAISQERCDFGQDRDAVLMEAAPVRHQREVAHQSIGPGQKMQGF